MLVAASLTMRVWRIAVYETNHEMSCSVISHRMKNKLLWERQETLTWLSLVLAISQLRALDPAIPVCHQNGGNVSTTIRENKSCSEKAMKTLSSSIFKIAQL